MHLFWSLWGEISDYFDWGGGVSSPQDYACWREDCSSRWGSYNA